MFLFASTRKQHTRSEKIIRYAEKPEKDPFLLVVYKFIQGSLLPTPRGELKSR